MKSNKVAKVFFGFLAVILVLAVVAEFGLRWFIGNQMAEEVHSSATGEKATISFSAQPLLFGVAKGELPHLEIHSPSTVVISHSPDSDIPTVSGEPEATITIDRLSLNGDNGPVAGNMVVNTRLNDEYLLAVIQNEMANATQQSADPTLEDLAGNFLSRLVKVTGLRSNAAEGTISVQVSGGAANLTLRPYASAHGLSFEALNANVFGIELPESVSSALTEGLRAKSDEMAGGLTLEDVEVYDGGLAFTLSGTDVPLSEVNEQTPA